MGRGVTRREVLALLPAAARAAEGDVSVLVLDASGALVQKEWRGAERPVPVGSLVKPFLALAHGEPFPEVDCLGGDACWYVPGHGKLGLVGALQHSCNRYFDALARAADRRKLGAVLARYGLASPPDDAPAESIWGRGRAWPVAPPALVRAYRELALRRGETGVEKVLAGLEAAARSGTADAVGRALPAPALAKTGTAPSSARGWGGDGFCAVVYPARNPRYTMLLRVEGRTGRSASEAAARRLGSLVEPPRDLRRNPR